MFKLPLIELVVFVSVISLSVTAAIMGILQTRPGGQKYKPLLGHSLALAIVGEAVILIFRAAAIKAIPLTGLFESMIVLTLLLGLIYLIMGMVIRQVWFGSVMSWLILLIVALTAFVAHPAAKPQEIASAPWAVAHGLAMILGGAMILLAVVTACVYLLGSHRLKQKQIAKVIGVVPNIQKLERINLLALKAALISFTIGLLTGIGGVWLKAEFLGEEPLAWLVDSKIIGMVIVWMVLTLVLVMHRLRLIKGKRIAHATIIAFVWIIFAFVGAHVLCKTKHTFSGDNLPVPGPARELNK